MKDFEDFDSLDEMYKEDLKNEPYVTPSEPLNTGDVIIKQPGGHGVNGDYARVSIRKLVKDKEAFCKHVESGGGIESFADRPIDSKYEYYMTKGGAFSWTEVAPVVLKLIRSYTGV